MGKYWHRTDGTFCSTLVLQGRSLEELREVYRAAHDAGLQALQEEVAAAAEGVSDSSSWGQLLEALEPIQVRLEADMQAMCSSAHSASQHVAEQASMQDRQAVPRIGMSRGAP